MESVEHNGKGHQHPDERLQLHILASGSKGNCSVVRDAHTGSCILVDCGISKRAFFERCADCGVDVTGIAAIVVSHEHVDHTKGLGVVTRGLAQAGVEPIVFASSAVHRASRELQAIEDAVDLRYFSAGDTLHVGGLNVHPFHTLHDAAESFGFRVEYGGDAIGFITDTGVVTDEAIEALRGCRVLALETNHDPKMLATGPYPAYLKARIASERGHLSNEQAADLLESLLDDALERVVGMHVSQHNNTYRLPVEALAATLARNDHPAKAIVGYQDRPIST